MVQFACCMVLYGFAYLIMNGKIVINSPLYPHFCTHKIPLMKKFQTLPPLVCNYQHLADPYAWIGKKIYDIKQIILHSILFDIGSGCVEHVSVF